jgi:hypothetical protein
MPDDILVAIFNGNACGVEVLPLRQTLRVANLVIERFRTGGLVDKVRTWNVRMSQECSYLRTS